MSVYLTGHFLAVLAYAFPTKAENKLKFYVFPYIYPYFHQDWRMFVPVPKQNYFLYIRYSSESKITDWQDVLYKLNSRHQHNRLAGHESLLLSISNSLRFYASSVDEKNEIHINDDSNIKFNVIKKIVTQFLILKNGSKPNALDIIIRIKDTNSPKDYCHFYKITS